MMNKCLCFPPLPLLPAAPSRPLNSINLLPRCKNVQEPVLPSGSPFAIAPFFSHFMCFRFPFTTTLLPCLPPPSIVSISPSFVDSSLLDTGYKPPNYLALLLTCAWAFFIALTFISPLPYLATVYAAMVNPSPCGCAMSPLLYLPCLPNYVKGYTLSVGRFSLPTLTTPSLSSTLSNVISTTTIHPINSHAWFFLKLNSIYDNSSFAVLSIFSANASVRLIGLSLPHLLLWRPSMPPPSKLSLLFPVWQFFAGSLTPNLTFILDCGHISLGPLPVVVDVANFLPYTHSDSSLAPSITHTSLFPLPGLYLLAPPCLPHSRAFSANNILLFPLSLPLLSGIPVRVSQPLPLTLSLPLSLAGFPTLAFCVGEGITLFSAG